MLWHISTFLLSIIGIISTKSTIVTLDECPCIGCPQWAVYCPPQLQLERLPRATSESPPPPPSCIFPTNSFWSLPAHLVQMQNVGLIDDFLWGPNCLNTYISCGYQTDGVKGNNFVDFVPRWLVHSFVRLGENRNHFMVKNTKVAGNQRKN